MDSDKGSVEGLRDKLYSRRNQGPMQDVRSPLSPQENEIGISWGGPPPMARPAVSGAVRGRWSFATKFLIGSVAFFVVAIAAGAYFFFGGANFISPNNI